MTTIEDKIEEKDLEEVIRICKTIIDEKVSNSGVAVFFPDDEDRKFYNELVKRGVMKVNPLEKDGYSFSEEIDTLMNFKGKVVGEIPIQAK